MISNLLCDLYAFKDCIIFNYYWFIILSDSLKHSFRTKFNVELANLNVELVKVNVHNLNILLLSN